jgi:hypothetical protein
MVTVTGFQQRKNQEGEPYFALEIQSDDLEFIVSRRTGRHYATVRKCFMSTTFNEIVCKKMIGKEMPGCILKEECDPFNYVIEDTGEEITLTHRNVYSPVEESNEEAVVFGKSNFVGA